MVIPAMHLVEVIQSAYQMKNVSEAFVEWSVTVMTPVMRATFVKIEYASKAVVMIMHVILIKLV